MKNLLPLLAIAPLAFSSCEKKSEPNISYASVTDTSTSAPTIGSNTSFNSTLANVVSNLDTNGAHFSITHIDQDLNQLAKAVDGILDIARKSSEDVPPNLNIVKLIKDLGLSKIDAMGRSSRANKDIWHNRLFIQTNGDRSGLLSIMGEEGSEWRAAEIAPADADLVIEFDLNLRRLNETMKVVTTSFGEEAEMGFAEAMQEKIAGGALTLGDVFGKTDLRATLIFSLDREKRWKVSEEIEMPTINAAIRIERGIWLWKQFGEEIEKNAEIGERDDLKTVKAPEEMDTPMGKLRPIIVLDEAKDLIWVSLTEDYLDKCLSKENTLASSDDFKQATAGFPDKGNGLFYVSADFSEEVLHQVDKAVKNLPAESEEAAIFNAVTNFIGLSGDINLSHGYAWSISNTKTGILCVGNSMLPDKGYGLMTGITPIATMAGLTAPIVVRQRSKADQIQAISNVRQIGLGLLEYDAEHGSYPTKLSELVDEGIMQKEALDKLINFDINGQIHEFTLIPGLNSSMPPDTIILHSPAPIDGKRVVLTIDNAATMIPEQEFQERINNQTSPE
jgi:hypothetical protein